MKWLLTTSKLVYFARRPFSRANAPLPLPAIFSKCCHSIEFVSLFILVFVDKARSFVYWTPDSWRKDWDEISSVKRASCCNVAQESHRATRCNRVISQSRNFHRDMKMYRVSRYVQRYGLNEKYKNGKSLCIYIVYVDWTWKKLLIYSYIILNFNWIQVMFTY